MLNNIKNKFKKNKLFGFTLIEIMVVVAIIAIISVIAVPNFISFLSKSKRSEVYLHLGAIHSAEKLYWAEHNTYTDNIKGPNSISWLPDGKLNYTYGFSGEENKNYIIGKLEASGDKLSEYTKADKNSFTAAAIADIDNDGKLDIITINEKREIKIVQDDIN